MLNNEMNTLFADGGMNQQGGTKDPVSGNDVPPGALQSEVRDDISAKLSEGEFVIPADVVRYIGLERLMKLRDEAKAGLARMAEIGQMGNSDQVENPEALHGDEFGQEIDDIMSEVDREGGGEHFAAGGIVSVPSPDKDILAKYGISRTSITNPALDVRVLENAAGQKMYMTYFNGKPSAAIPAGYKESTTPYQAPTYTPTTKTETDKTTTTAAGTTTDTAGGGGPGNDSSGGASVGTSTGAGGGSSSSVGNSALGIAIGAIANAVTNPSVVSVPEDSLSVDAQGNTVSANAATAAANAAAVAASLANENSPMSENDSSAAAVSANDAAASANAASGVSGEGGSSDGTAGGAVGDNGDGSGSYAKGGLITKRSKKTKK